MEDPLQIRPADVEAATYLIDPNTASWASLARLPQVGQRRARALVAYRERYRRQHGAASAVFRGPADLLGVRGFGEQTVGAIKPYLVFREPSDGSAAGQGAVSIGAVGR